MWRRLCDLGISNAKRTRCGCHAGRKTNIMTTVAENSVRVQSNPNHSPSREEGYFENLHIEDQLSIIPADVPWMSPKLKSNFHSFKSYRNAVNRKRKSCKGKYYESKILKLKGEHPKGWWKEVKRISGMSTRTRDLLSKIKVDEVEGLLAIDIANVINKAFLEPLEDYRLATPLPPLPLENNSTFPVVSEERILKLLSQFNPPKASRTTWHLELDLKGRCRPSRLTCYHHHQQVVPRTIT